MKRRGLAFSLIVVLLLTFGLTAAGCGDDDGGGEDTPAADTEEPSDGEPTEASEPSSGLEAYFEDLDDVEDAFRIGQASSQADFTSVDETTPLEDVITLFEELQGVIDEFVAGLEGIDPPPAAEAAHEETIAGFQAISELIDEAIAAVEGGATADELFAFFETDEAVQASEALDATCNALQALADDNSIAVDLSCAS
jgi:hypothetical protein